MKKKTSKQTPKKSEWSQRIKLTPEESLKRMRDFSKRKEAFVAAVRKGKNRSVSA